MGRISDAREKLLAVAFDLIWDSSYGTVSVDQICQRAKVNKGSFYYFFKTKTDLVVEAYEEHWKQRQPELDRIFSAQRPPLQRISEWCAYIYEGQRCRARQAGAVCGCPYISVGVEVAMHDPKIRGKVTEMIERNLRYLETAISDARQQGHVRVSEVKTTAQWVYALSLGMIVQARVTNDLSVLKDLEPAVFRLLGVKPAN
jgi:TetR/AcrR family transcriptional repressor of nem operon